MSHTNSPIKLLWKHPRRKRLIAMIFGMMFFAMIPAIVLVDFWVPYERTKNGLFTFEPTLWIINIILGMLAFLAWFTEKRFVSILAGAVTSVVLTSILLLYTGIKIRTQTSESILQTNFKTNFYTAETILPIIISLFAGYLIYKLFDVDYKELWNDLENLD